MSVWTQPRVAAQPWTRWLPVALVALALLARLAALALWPQPLEGDAVLYDQLATSIAEGRGLANTAGEPTAVRGPAYPALVAASYRLFGPTPTPIYLLQIALDGVAVVLLYRFTRGLLADARAAAVAGFLYAVYPPFIQQSIMLYTETLFTLLLLAGLVAFWDASRRASLRRFALSGLLLAIATLLRPVTLLFPVWLVACLWPVRGQTGLLRPAAVLIGVFVLVLAPWTYRNYTVFGAFVPVSTLSGLNFYQAHVGIDQPDALRVRRPTEALSLIRQELWDKGIDPDGLNEAQLDRYLQRGAWQRIVQHPARAAGLFLNRFLRLWLNLGYDGPPSKASLALAAGNGVVLLGLVLAWTRFRGAWWKWALPSLAVLLYFTLFHMVIHAQVRYSFPVVPYAMLFAGHAASRIGQSRTGHE